MAFPPINIFSRRVDPGGVIGIVRRQFPECTVVEEGRDWTSVSVVTRPKNLFKKQQVLTLAHSKEYYDGPDWPMQISGMQNYFSSFPDSPNKAQVLQLIRSFQFSLSVPLDDLNFDSNDPRMETLFFICKYLDGVFFLPTSLRDATGKVLIAQNGFSDPKAIFPAIPDDGAPVYDDDEEDEEEEELVPPTPRRIAERVLALTAVTARATLELDHNAGNVEDADEIRERIIEWVKLLGIDDELEVQEWKVLQRRAGLLEQQDFVNAMWRVEGLAVLAWALKLHPIPAYDELVIPPELFTSIGIFDVEAGQALLESAEVRSHSELDAMHSHLLAFHWRMRDFSIRPQAMNFVEFSEQCWFGSFDLSQFRVLEDDLALGEVPIAQADEETLSRVASTAMERHLAINWLHGYCEIYSETDTST